MGTWVDWIIVIFFGYALADGWRRGLIVLLANFASFLGSLWFAIRFHALIGAFLTRTFGLTQMWSTVLGYFAVGVASQLVIEVIALPVLSYLLLRIFRSKTNTWLGSVVSGINALLMCTFILVFLLALPLRGTIHEDIRTSGIGSKLVGLAEKYGGQVHSSLENLADSAARFLTVKPGSRERIHLDLPPNMLNMSVNSADEQAMVTLVNEERRLRDIAPLAVDVRLQKDAEEKSRDMFVRRYFSHYDPDGKTVSDRFGESGISFGIVGENIAYAPDLSAAHKGLMESTEHRENILEPRYHHIGIGVVDAGVYGSMFTQVFTD